MVFDHIRTIMTIVKQSLHIQNISEPFLMHPTLCGTERYSLPNLQMDPREKFQLHVMQGISSQTISCRYLSAADGMGKNCRACRDSWTICLNRGKPSIRQLQLGYQEVIPPSHGAPSETGAVPFPSPKLAPDILPNSVQTFDSLLPVYPLPDLTIGKCSRSSFEESTQLLKFA